MRALAPLVGKGLMWFLASCNACYQAFELCLHTPFMMLSTGEGPPPLLRSGPRGGKVAMPPHAALKVPRMDLNSHSLLRRAGDLDQAVESRGLWVTHDPTDLAMCLVAGY